MRQGEGRTAPAFLGQYVRMLRSDGASAGDDGLGRAESRPSRIGPINLDVKQMGERNAGNPHVAFDVAGTGDVAWSRGISAKAGAPVLDPTTEEAVAAWRAPATGERGGQPIYSAIAIETGLALRLVFHQPLRQTEGLLR